MKPLSLIKRSNVVFIFHTISSKEWFRNTLKCIQSIYDVLTIDDLEQYFNKQKNFKHSCYITFDDGDQSVYEHAFPVLQEMNVPAAVFVSPKIIEQQKNFWFQEMELIFEQVNEDVVRRDICECHQLEEHILEGRHVMSIFKSMPGKTMQETIDFIKTKHKIETQRSFNMNKDQLLEMNRSSLITIGAHSMTHPILSNETDEDALAEIKSSIQELSTMLGQSVEYFAYPNGQPNVDFSKREQDILREQGVKLAFATEPVYFKQDSDPLAIPRRGFSFGNKAFVMTKLLAGPLWEQSKALLLAKRDENRQVIELKSQNFWKQDRGVCPVDK